MCVCVLLLLLLLLLLLCVSVCVVVVVVGGVLGGVVCLFLPHNLLSYGLNLNTRYLTALDEKLVFC